jgi:hypothetical protein
MARHAHANRRILLATFPPDRHPPIVFHAGRNLVAGCAMTINALVIPAQAGQARSVQNARRAAPQGRAQRVIQ